MDVVSAKVNEIEETHGVNLGIVPDNKWLWLTSTDAIKPLHFKAGRGKKETPGYVRGTYTYHDKGGVTKTGEHCVCAECAKRETIRKELRELGFIYTPDGHKVPTGETGHYGNCCQAPKPFFRKRSNVARRAPGTSGIPTITNNQPQPQQPDDDLDAALASLELA